VFIVLGLAGACAPHVDPRFAREAEAASALYVSGRYRDAADRWLVAARRASSPVDRDEARYRAALSFVHAGDTARADALLAELGAGRGERAARASFDRARLTARSDPERGDTLRLAAVRKHPSSGLAAEAAREHLAFVEERQGAGPAVAACRALHAELGTTELAEALSYECARRTEAAGDLPRARDAYLATAAQHPYPEGAYWDDALTGAARCEERLGRPARAVELLERLLAERERSVAVGSYERSRYAQARFHIAELYRDALGDPARARREFRRVFDEHQTSLLRDDALFNEASLAQREGDAKAACEAVRLLQHDLPDSRYVGCGPLLCATAAAAARPCPRAAR